MARRRAAPALAPTVMLALAAGAAGVVGVAPPRPALAGWSAPAQLNTTDDDPRRVFLPHVAGAASGGFHTVYQAWDERPQPRSEFLRYHRVGMNGAVGPRVTIQSPDRGSHNSEIAEAPNGDVHVVWESWGDGPEVGWARSVNNGVSFQPGVELTSSGDKAQGPQVAGLGRVGSNQAVMTYWHTETKQIRYRAFNGSTWGVDMDSDDFSPSGATTGGISHDVRDGAVVKLFDAGDHSDLRRYTTGPEFGAPRRAMDHDFWVNPSIATNASGQTMVMYDRDYVAKARLVNPDGSRSVEFANVFEGRRFFGAVTNIPGTNDFYAVTSNATQSRAQNRTVLGRRFNSATGQWGPVETIATLPYDELIQKMDVAADPSGSLMVVFEFWEIINGDPNNYLTKPNVYYSTSINPEPWRMADANGDGSVNVADLGIVATNYNDLTPTHWGRRGGDLNGDGAIDVRDLGVLATYFNYPRTAGAADASFAEALAAYPELQAAVPEPTTLTLLVPAGLALACARPRRRC